MVEAVVIASRLRFILVALPVRQPHIAARNVTHPFPLPVHRLGTGLQFYTVLRRAPKTTDPAYSPRLYAPPLEKLAAMEEPEFREIFRGRPVRPARHPGSHTGNPGSRPLTCDTLSSDLTELYSSTQTFDSRGPG
jgi:hypothetical protein